MWVHKKTVAWQNGEENTLRFEFKVQHPRCVNQITKLNSRRLQVKTLYIILYVENDGNT
jgi:hypothetical protein